jgi:hypothetical protein
MTEQKGTGPVWDGKQGLDNEQIDTIMEDYRPNYLGCIPRDQMGTLKPKKGIPVGWVQNTDPVGMPGKHWVAFYYDGPSMHYFDSFADEIPKDVLKDLKKFVEEKLKPKHMLKLKVNRVKMQDVRTENCGWMACDFLQAMMQGKEWKDTTNYNQAKKGEASVQKLKEKYPAFKYI